MLAALACALPFTAVADERFGADVTLTTDYVSRGVSQTLSGAALQGSLWLAHESGWTASLWGSNVDYMGYGDPDDGARIEIDAVVEYERALTERLSLALGRIQYVNPGTLPGYDYDYAEWTARLSVDGRHHLVAASTDDVFGSGARALYLAAGTGFDLPAGVRLDLEAGRFDLRRALDWGEVYYHGRLSLSGEVDAFTWQLAWHATSSRARRAFYPSVVEPRVVLSLTYSTG
jgi:uncharacterized protein (TIGR02001 family)